MRFTARIVLLASMTALFATASSLAALDVEGYVELTIARLELIEESWREKDQPPSNEELEALYEEHGTDRETYFCFSGEKKRAIDAYLEKHPEQRETVETLAAAIRQRITQRREE